MTAVDRIGAPTHKQLRRNYCAAYLAAMMEARGFIIQVRTSEFKHEALDKLDAMLCEAMDKVIEQNTEIKTPADEALQFTQTGSADEN